MTSPTANGVSGATCWRTASIAVPPIERLMRLQALRARPRPWRQRLLKDEGDRQIATVPSNLLARRFAAERPNQKSIADFTTSGRSRAGSTCRS